MLYRIKPLEWERIPQSAKGEALDCETVFGYLIVWRDGIGKCHWREGVVIAKPWHDCGSIEDGKAKAEAYYRERLLAALEEVPDGASATAVHHEGEPDHDRPPGAQRP